MKRPIMISVIILLLLTISHLVSAQENITIVAPTSEVAENLDLYAVAEIFKDSENLEEFEKALNDPEIGINNLDLDEDGYVDYIRVVEQITDYTHVIILQVPLGENEFQDVATIEIEKTGDESYNMQVHGNEVIYGSDYYVSPTYVHIHIHRWPIILWMFRPVYRPYRSVVYFGYFPPWWRPYHPVTVHVYRTRTVRYTRRATFEGTRVSRVKTVHKVNYKPHVSNTVKKKREVTHPNPGPERIKRVPGLTIPERKTTTVKKGMKPTNQKTGKTTIKGEIKKTSRPKVRKETTVKSEVKKTTKPKLENKKAVKTGVKKTTKPNVEKKKPVKKGDKKTTVKKKR